MRYTLAEAGKDDDRYLGPEWIGIANEIVRGSAGRYSPDCLNQ